MDLDGINQLASRLSDIVDDATQRARRYTRYLVIWVGVVCVVGFVLGIMVFDGWFRRPWLIGGGVAAIVGTGAALLARSRTTKAVEAVPKVGDEVRSLLSANFGEAQELLSTFVNDHDGDDNDGDNNDGGSRPKLSRASMLNVARSFWGLRGLAKDGAELTTNLRTAITSLGALPQLSVLAGAITTVFGVLSIIFAIILSN